MNSRTWLLALGGTAFVTTLAVHGCSSDPAEGGDDDGGSSSSSGGSSGASSSGGNGSSSSSSSGSSGVSSSGGRDSGSDAAADSGLACYTPDGAGGWSTVVQRAGSNECTTAAIDDIWEACAGPEADDAACTAVATASAACFDCLTGGGPPATRKTGIFQFSDGDAVPYSDVCAANAIDQAAECGTKIDNLNSCTIGACEACFEEDQETVDTCVGDAESGPCAEFVTTTDCDALLADPDNEDTIVDRCGDVTAEAASEDDFKTAASYICGAPPV